MPETIFKLEIIWHKSFPEIFEMQSPGLLVSYLTLTIVFKIPNKLNPKTIAPIAKIRIYKFFLFIFNVDD